MTVTHARPATTPPAPGTREPRRGAAARFRGRWRVALRFGARDARRNKGRTALVAIMVALPVAVGAFAATTLWSTRDTPERTVAEQLGPRLQASASFFGTEVQQTPDGNSSAGGASAETQVASVDAAFRAALPGGARAVAGVDASVVVFAGELQVWQPAVQIDVGDPSVAAAFPLAEGTLPGAGEVALGADIARQLGLEVGDTVGARLNGRVGQVDGPADLGSATLSGILAARQPRSVTVLYPASGPITPPATVGGPTGPTVTSPFWFVSGDTPVTWDDVLRLNDAGFVVTSRQVVLDPPPHSAVPYFDGTPPRSASDLLQTWGLFVAVIAVALLEAVLLVGPAFAVGARRSARSLALVAANGGTARTLRAVVLGTGVVIGVGGALAGTAIGLAGAAVALSSVPGGLRFYSVPWPIVLGIAVVGVLLAAAGAWLPARGASKADVVAVLAGRRGETAARRWPAVVGTVLAVAGYAAAVVGGITTQVLLLIGGVIVGEIGLVLACGGIVALLGRMAGRLPLSWRFALRDASRHRSRTSPAIAAVLVATAGASAGLVYSTAQSDHDYRSQAIVAAPGVLLLADPSGKALATPADLATVTGIVHDVLPDVGDLRPVTTLAETVDDGVTTSAHLRPPGEGLEFSVSGTAIMGPIVDDGDLVEAFAIPSPDTLGPRSQQDASSSPPARRSTTARRTSPSRAGIRTSTPRRRS
ncbi:FtsX-like permease family protein [Xylanimonas allomyrinae]|uniref:FtsX-like permease family protein n=1 Tax=Xylanimonas allomyrinae TaxID=2509459 RepID=A0A4P6F2R2_9MICO|nr:FtsX-like permease family protein [Xylanimonas allomyrinae]QAY64648.1 FtsX-like permease family protein [Xylanimonas allomyrinae]